MIKYEVTFKNGQKKIMTAPTDSDFQEAMRKLICNNIGTTPDFYVGTNTMINVKEIVFIDKVES